MNNTNTSVTTSKANEDTRSEILNCIDDLSALETLLERAKWALSEVLNATAEDLDDKDPKKIAEWFFYHYDDVCNASGVANDYVFDVSKEVTRIRKYMENVFDKG